MIRTIAVAPLLAAGTALADPILLLDVASAGASKAALKLIVLNAGDTFAEDAALELQFLADGALLDLPEPGWRTTRVPAACSGWAPDHAAVILFGPYAFADDGPQRIEAKARLGDGAFQTLGTLVRDGDSIRLERVCPEPPGDGARTIAVATCEFLDPYRIVLRVGYLNCGAQFDRDYWAFLHFEPDPIGENLSVTTEMKLHPSAQATDSSTWAPDEITVATFGPFALPADLDEPVYIRVGLYDRDGDGGRVPLAGSGERQRVLVGRMIPRDGALAFERAPIPGEEAGW